MSCHGIRELEERKKDMTRKPLGLELERCTEKSLRKLTPRDGCGSKGRPIVLVTNLFRVEHTFNGNFYHYALSIECEGGVPIEGKKKKRREIMKKMFEVHGGELGQNMFCFDGWANIYTMARLETKPAPYDVCINKQRYKVEMKLVAEIPMGAVQTPRTGYNSPNSKKIPEVLNIILRRYAEEKGLVNFGQRFFGVDYTSFGETIGGVQSQRGFSAAFRVTSDGLYLNADVSATMIIPYSGVIEFLESNLRLAVGNFNNDHWAKAERLLKDRTINVKNSDHVYKIAGLTGRPCNEQTFELQKKSGAKMTEWVGRTDNITVEQYYIQYHKINVKRSKRLPCVIVGKPNRPIYIPMELCTFTSRNRFTNPPTPEQTASLEKLSVLKPVDWKFAVSNALQSMEYNDVPMFQSCGISITTSFTEVVGRTLQPPRLLFGDDSVEIPKEGKWTIKTKKLVEPTAIKWWAVASFLDQYDIRSLVNNLIRLGKSMGIIIEQPFGVCEEETGSRRDPADQRVEKMFQKILQLDDYLPTFILCLLPDQKNCELYGPWHKKIFARLGIFTQCMAPTKGSAKHLKMLLLKINAKLGGLNLRLSAEEAQMTPVRVYRVPTAIFGIDVSHGSSKQCNRPSVVAVVGSRKWPSTSSYRAFLRSQAPRTELITCLFEKLPNGQPDGIIWDLLNNFYTSSGDRKPDQIIIFRDGVSESEFSSVLNYELDQVIEACKYLDEKWEPKFLVIVAQKENKTRLVRKEGRDNVPPGTIVDKPEICQPYHQNFYFCAHKGQIGTSKPVHYHVLLDQIGCSPDDLQELIHSLSYVSQRSVFATSNVAPLHYAHLAAAHMSSIIDSEDFPETSSEGEMTRVGNVPVRPLPKLHENVAESMFFC